ncbi:MAG: YdcF family protein [Clostridia bacterium]|nr:YdcF family protein [Clostridia bacterium]
MNRKPYDAILLLGLQLDENDQPLEELKVRVKAAAQLYATGACPVIIACGGTTPGHSVSETDVMACLLMQEGVPDEAIIRENESQDTIGNMRFAAKRMGGAKGRRVYVVTSDYHVRRAVMTARRVGFKAKGFPAALVHDEAWKTLRGKEFAYTVDMLLGWQDEGKSRPKWTYALFDFVFGRK